MQETAPSTTPAADGQWIWVPYSEPQGFPWPEVIVAFIAVAVLVGVIALIVRFQRKALTCARDALEMGKTGSDLQREAIELVRKSHESHRQLIATQEETNRLLAELNSRLAERRIQ
jgi:hypothetical protein